MIAAKLKLTARVSSGALPGLEGGRTYRLKRFLTEAGDWHMVISAKICKALVKFYKECLGLQICNPQADSTLPLVY
jgi:hypothetical protein